MAQFAYSPHNRSKLARGNSVRARARSAGIAALFPPECRRHGMVQTSGSVHAIACPDRGRTFVQGEEAGSFHFNSTPIAAGSPFERKRVDCRTANSKREP